MAATYSLTLVRHGQSTGIWRTVLPAGLTWACPPGGCGSPARRQLLKDRGFTFDIAYTSVLKRAIKTLWIILETMELEWITGDSRLAAQ